MTIDWRAYETNGFWDELITANGRARKGAGNLTCMLAELSDEEGFPPLYCLFFGEASEVPQFFEAAGREFPWHIPSIDDFFASLESFPPRICLLKEGKIEKDWDYESFSKGEIQAILEGADVI